MKKYLGVVFTALMLALGLPAAAFAQSGHFVGTQTCTDLGTILSCSGKVAGLGGTTFEIKMSADATATVECTNPGGNVAPGQTFDFPANGSSGPLATPRNGQYRYSGLQTDPPPSAPADSCPNDQWSAAVTDVTFSNVTLTLYEDGVPVDTATAVLQ